LPDSYRSLGSQLTQSVANPYYARGGSGVIGGSTVAHNQLLRPFSAIQFHPRYNDTASAEYNSLNDKAQKRFTRGLTFLATYTWSKNEDSTWGAGNFLNASQTSPQEVYDLAAKWGRSVIDIPHRFTAATTYDLPIGKGLMFSIANPVLNLFAGNWSLNTVTICLSGSPPAIYQNINNNKALGTFVQRPNLTGTNPCYSGSPQGRLDSYLNPAASSTAPAFTYGNAPPDINCLSPGYANWDISLFKSFPIRKRVSLQFRAEARNAFSTPQFRVWKRELRQDYAAGELSEIIQLGGRISL
jgi:hypothetical protein